MWPLDKISRPSEYEIFEDAAGITWITALQ